ncbi:MAG: sulfotransferase domain-containing protein [Proteobacteria bacterium]|nr:sulfotransferase domain-containing protein [Pseudomonadota bacterium]MBU6426124.1 sulfotransferase domain-containing protein [Rhodospirillales bacterium]
MYASGSTWLFNATREVVAALSPIQPVHSAFIETWPHLAKLPAGFVIVKSHALSPGLARLLEIQSARILVTIRDPRDAVTSLMQYMGQSFEKALKRVEHSARFCSRYAAHERAILLPYESGFTESADAFDKLAECFGQQLTASSRGRLFAATRREAIEHHISQLDNLPTSWRNPHNGDLLDTSTQWHAHHAGRTGATGRWRQYLSAEHILRIETALHDFMVQHDYILESNLKP